MCCCESQMAEQKQWWMKLTNRLHDCLGFNVQERALQIEWFATWSPIEKQYNVHVDELHRIYPRHIIEILDRLNKGAVLTILVDKPCWMGNCFKIEKTQHFATSGTFAADVSSFFWFFAQVHLLPSDLTACLICFSTVHIVGSLLLKLPSMKWHRQWPNHEQGACVSSGRRWASIVGRHSEWTGTGGRRRAPSVPQKPSIAVKGLVLLPFPPSL